jgi:acylphosphatase
MGSGGEIKRLHVVYSGRVQGVGFRYTVCHAAEPFGVSGIVRNLWDGTVELVAEGGEAELVGLLNAIRASRLARNITGESVRWRDATGEYESFGVAF